MIIDEGDKKRCKVCKRRVHKDELLKYGCLICNEVERGIMLEELIQIETKWLKKRNEADMNGYDYFESI